MKRKEFNFIYQIKTFSMLLIILTHHTFTDKQRLFLLFPFTVDMAVPLLVLCTGFLNENSYINKLNGTSKKWYSFENIIKKLTPIVVPYLFFVSIEIAYNLINGFANINGIIYGILTGGWGQGSYYIPIIIQIYLLFPFISWISKDKNRIIVSAVIVTAYCFLCSYFSINDSIYKIISIRYIPFATVGCYLFNTKMRTGTMVFGALISCGFILLLNYTGYNPIVFSQWTTTSLPVIGWATFLFYLFSNISSCHCFLKRIANSSFFIFLTQKTYLYVFSNLKPVYHYLPNAAIIIFISIILQQLYTVCVGKRIKGIHIENSDK